MNGQYWHNSYMVLSASYLTLICLGRAHHSFPLTYSLNVPHLYSHLHFHPVKPQTPPKVTQEGTSSSLAFKQWWTQYVWGAGARRSKRAALGAPSLFNVYTVSCAVTLVFVFLFCCPWVAIQSIMLFYCTFKQKKKRKRKDRERHQENRTLRDRVTM